MKIYIKNGNFLEKMKKVMKLILKVIFFIYLMQILKCNVHKMKKIQLIY